VLSKIWIADFKEKAQGLVVAFHGYSVCPYSFHEQNGRGLAAGHLQCHDSIISYPDKAKHN
jgi:hypothetical protein